MNIAYVGSMVTDNMARYSGLSVAGNKFQLGITSRFADHATCDFFNVLPYASFPRGKYIWVHRKVQPGNPTVHTIPYINMLLLKQVTCALSLFVQLFKWARRYKKNDKILVIYNLFSFEFLPVFLISKLFHIKRVAIVADLPPRQPKGLLHKLEAWCEKNSVRAFKKLVVITKYIALDFAPQSEYKVVEGGVFQPIVQARMSQPRQNIILYTGALDENSDIELLLEAFYQIDEHSWQLQIAGNGYKKNQVLEYTQKDARIRYLGFMDNDKILVLQRQAKILVCPRKPNSDVTRYTFPSKIMEYMSSGNAVVCFELEGIPAAYTSYLHVVSPCSSRALQETLTSLMRNPAERNERQIDFISTKDWPSISREVLQFMGVCR